jgi:hypothetical protein
MRVLCELRGNIRRRPQSQFGTDPHLTIRCENLHNIDRQVGACRQLLSMLYTRISSKSARPVRPTGTLLKQSKRDPRASPRVHIVRRESSIVRETNRGPFEPRQREHLRTSQLRPTRQLLGELRIRSRNHAVNKVRRQRRILGQSIQSTMHSTILAEQRLNGQRFTTTARNPRHTRHVDRQLDKLPSAVDSDTSVGQRIGVKALGLNRYGERLTSADSMAWSLRGRRTPDCTPTHKNEANCLVDRTNRGQGVSAGAFVELSVVALNPGV